jgi:hypothetical protein
MKTKINVKPELLDLYFTTCFCPVEGQFWVDSDNRAILSPTDAKATGTVWGLASYMYLPPNPLPVYRKLLERDYCIIVEVEESVNKFSDIYNFTRTSRNAFIPEQYITPLELASGAVIFLNKADFEAHLNKYADLILNRKN